MFLNTYYFLRGFLTMTSTQNSNYKETVLTIKINKNTFFNIKNKICISLFFILLILSIINVQITGKGNFFLGYTAKNIESWGMSPTYNQNSWMLIQKIKPNKIKNNDVIAFVIRENPDVIISRRVSEIYNDDKYNFKTSSDENIDKQNWTVSEDQLFGKVIFSLKNMRGFMNFISSKVGFILFLIFNFSSLILLNILLYYKKCKFNKNKSNVQIINNSQDTKGSSKNE